MSMEGINQSSLHRIYEQTVDALVAAAAQRDKTAEGHSKRVMRYSMAIGRALGLSEEVLTDLKYAASLHDIGKISVSRKILNKIGKLSADEFAIMKQHSTLALRVLDRVDCFKNSIPMIKHHHERFDGKGYPDQLAGLDIPLGSRIIAVAEAFDILTSDVPWRDAFSVDSAVQEIEACAKTQFDPVVVKSFKKAVEQGCLEL